MSRFRPRLLIFLAIAAFAMLLLGVLAIQWHIRHAAAHATPHLLFADLSSNLHNVTAIRIETKRDGIVDVTFLPLRGWVLTKRGDYPASFDTVRRLLSALTQMTTIEPKTARPDWFHYVDLDAPPEGAGTRISVFDGSGHTLADLIVGKRTDTPINGPVTLFVRKANEQQSWLVHSPSDLHIELDDWFERHAIALDQRQVAQIEFMPLYGPPYILRRTAPGQPFDLFGTVRANFIKAPPQPLADYADKLTNIPFTDAGPQGQFVFTSRTAKIRIRTFNGLMVNIEVIRIGADYWARIDASAAPGRPAAEKQATAINAMAFDWAFKLRPAQGAIFLTSLDGLKRRIALATAEKQP